jgi:hypothetical protein
MLNFPEYVQLLYSRLSPAQQADMRFYGPDKLYGNDTYSLVAGRTAIPGLIDAIAPESVLPNKYRGYSPADLASIANWKGKLDGVVITPNNIADSVTQLRNNLEFNWDMVRGYNADPNTRGISVPSMGGLIPHIVLKVPPQMGINPQQNRIQGTPISQVTVHELMHSLNRDERGKLMPQIQRYAQFLDSLGFIPDYSMDNRVALNNISEVAAEMPAAFMQGIPLYPSIPRTVYSNLRYNEEGIPKYFKSRSGPVPRRARGFTSLDYGNKFPLLSQSIDENVANAIIKMLKYATRIK